MTGGLPKVIEQLQQAGGGLTDGQLLARFVAARDEASFAALLRRHGPMVLGVCRRVLRDCHDAEDAFQATFLLLARKAATVVKRESVGSYLYAVAYHTALEATAAITRRRHRERQVQDMPHPEAAAAEAPVATPDWRPLLDRELSRLSERYRAAVVLCDLEGRPRKEAARLLGVPEGTLSSRLTRARKLLAKRLTGRGLTLSGAVLATALAADAASAQVPAALAGSTVRVAALVAAGQLAGVSTPAVVLMKGVMQAMFLNKLRLVVGAVMVTAALGAVGVTCRPGGQAVAQQSSAPERLDGGKPLTEVEALRKENELLRINNNVLLEKVRAQEAELRGLRGHPGAGDARGGRPLSGAADVAPDTTGPLIPGPGQRSNGKPRPSAQGVPAGNVPLDPNFAPAPEKGPGRTTPVAPGIGTPGAGDARPGRGPAGEVSGLNVTSPDAAPAWSPEIETALKQLRGARDKEDQLRAVQALDVALTRLRQQLNPGTGEATKR